MEYGVKITLSASSPVPEYTGGVWASGLAQFTGGSRLDGWTSGYLISIGPVGERVDISQHGNYAMMDDASILISANGYHEFDLAGASILGATLELVTLIGSTVTYRWTGVVSAVDWTGAEVALTVESMASVRHKEIPSQILTNETAPNISQDSSGKPVPIVWGAVERMTPPVLESDHIPEVGIRAYSSPVDFVDLPTTHLMTGNFNEGAIPDLVLSNRVTMFYLKSIWGTITAGNAGTWMGTAVDGAIGGDTTHDMYVEVSSGTGSGQRRKITYVSRITRTSNGITPQGYYEGAACTLLTPWDTLPDATSTFIVYKVDRLARFAVADQGAFAVVKDKESEVPLATDTTQIGTILVADVSSEFAAGEQVLSLAKLPNSTVYGRTGLEDGVTVTGATRTASYASHVIAGSDEFRFYEVFCAAQVEYPALSSAEIKDLYLIGSLDVTGLGAYARPHAFAFATDFTGQVTILTPIFDASTMLSAQDANAFSPSLAPDGQRLNFQTFSYKIPLSIPISSIRKIDYGFMSPVDYRSPTVYVGGAARVNVTKAPGSDVLINDSGTAISGYNQIRPNTAPAVNILTVSDYANDIFSTFARSDYWRAILSYSGTATITISDASLWPDGTYEAILSTGIAGNTTVVEREICLAASYGDVTLSGTTVDLQAGRRFTSPWDIPPSGGAFGDPILLARDAAKNMVRRDLNDFGGISSAFYAALPADPINAVIYEREKSDSLLAKMCAEFNWVSSHDSNGTEVALPFLATGFDYTVSNSDIISGTFDGLKQTSIDDLISLPTIRRSWTQADGFRAAASVPALDAAPASVTEANVATYAPGFDSPAQGVAAYAILHEAAEQTTSRQTGSIDYQWTNDIQGLLIDSGRLRWGAMRKDLATFCVSDEHAAAWALLGRRVSLTHRRYIKTARTGTIVARYWYASLGQTQLTVMLDP